MIFVALKSRISGIFLLIFSLISLSLPAQHGESHTDHAEEGKLDIKGEIFGHIRDAHDWHIFSWDKGTKHATIPLPVILYSPEKGFDVFMSSRFEHGHASYEGYHLNHENGKIEREDGVKFYNFSLTKNVISMLLDRKSVV